MAKNKTQPTRVSATSFLETISPNSKKEDALKVLSLMEEITNEEAVMWGSSIIGFGQYHYKYESGREGDFLMIGFSPRKQNLTIYLMTGFEDYERLLSKLGKYKTGKSCLYIKKLDDVDENVLIELLTNSYQAMKTKYA